MSNFAAKVASSRLVVGPHNLLVRNGITFNDRTQLETYWVEDFTGFEKPDLELPTEVDPQSDGETPLPASRGGRTMTMTGYIRAGTYPKILEMSADLEDSLIDLIEWPMVIKVQAGSPFFTQPDVQISCRPSDWSIDKKISQSDLDGIFTRAFTVALRASKPRYLSTAIKVVTLTPTTWLTFPGGGGGLIFPGGGGGLTFPYPDTKVASNVGNWAAQPVIRFTGIIGDSANGIQVINSTNGQALTVTGPIAAGEYIEVDVAAGTVKDQTGAYRSSRKTSASDWLQIEGKRGGSTGDNTLLLNVYTWGAGGQVTATYRDSSM
jgi:hypothetical protein